ncbi:MAG: GNAT family N-acetyltransferase [Chloroflexi bacterium]|nr:GNAT family N-acetyltransferase [Chloroflexota bacterium]
MPLNLLAPEQVAGYRETIIESLADQLVRSGQVPPEQSRDAASQRFDHRLSLPGNYFFTTREDIVWLFVEQPGQLSLMLPPEAALNDTLLQEIETWAADNDFQALRTTTAHSQRFEQNGYIVTNVLMEKHLKISPQSSLTLQSMTPEHFDTYLEALIVDYGQEKLKAGNFSEETWLEESRAEVMQLVPQKLETPGHFVFTLHNPDGEVVGHLWISRRPMGDDEGFWIYDIEVKEAHRRKGYGTQALLALEAFTKSEGLDRIGLHVFGHNSGARTLYEKMGYDTKLLVMKKTLTEVLS